MGGASQQPEGNRVDAGKQRAEDVAALDPRSVAFGDRADVDGDALEARLRGLEIRTKRAVIACVALGALLVASTAWHIVRSIGDDAVVRITDGERRAVLDSTGLTFYVRDKKAVSLHADPETDGRTLTIYYADEVPAVLLGENRPGSPMALNMMDEQKRDVNVVVMPGLIGLAAAGEHAHLGSSQLTLERGEDSAFFNRGMLQIESPDGNAALTPSILTLHGQEGRKAELSAHFEPFLHLQDTETSKWVTPSGAQPVR